MIKGIVYGATFFDAQNKLTEIINEYVRYYGEDCVFSISCGNHRYTAEFQNGDVWCAMGAHESVRGQCCNVAYIDRAIGIEKINTLILPTVKAAPWTATHYYGIPKETEKEADIWNTR